MWDVIMPQSGKEDYEQKFVGWEMNQNGKMGPRVASMANSMDPAK